MNILSLITLTIFLKNISASVYYTRIYSCVADVSRNVRDRYDEVSNGVISSINQMRQSKHDKDEDSYVKFRREAKLLAMKRTVLHSILQDIIEFEHATFDKYLNKTIVDPNWISVNTDKPRVESNNVLETVNI